MGRIGRGWQLSKESWAIVKADRSLLAFPVFAGIGALVTVAVFGGAGAGLYSTSAPLAIVIGVIGLYLVIAFSIFCIVALTSCAARSLEGIDTKAGEGWAAARGRLRPISGWAGLQLVVGALITAIQAVLREGAGQLIGSSVGGLANFARFATEDRVVGQFERPQLESAFRTRGRAARAAIEERHGGGLPGAARGGGAGEPVTDRSMSAGN
jgi:hypothetical protein